MNPQNKLKILRILDTATGALKESSPSNWQVITESLTGAQIFIQEFEDYYLVTGIALAYGPSGNQRWYGVDILRKVKEKLAGVTIFLEHDLGRPAPRLVGRVIKAWLEDRKVMFKGKIPKTKLPAKVGAKVTIPGVSIQAKGLTKGKVIFNNIPYDKVRDIIYVESLDLIPESAVRRAGTEITKRKWAEEGGNLT